MVTIKKSLHLFVALLFALMPLVSNATESVGVVQDSEHNVVDPSSNEFVQEFSNHHLMDDYYYSFFGDAKKGKHYGFALPIILIDNGLKVFMSSEDFVYKGKVVEKGGQYYKFYHGKIYKTDADGTINYNEKHYPTNEKPLDFSITKNVFGLFLATVLLFLGFTALAKTYKSSANSIPKGVGRILEPLVIYVRDEMARPNIGEKRHKTYMPYLLSVFFLIFLLNLMGLTPLGLNVTGNIAVTFCLAIFTFLYTNFSGNKDYWKHIFWMPGVPVPMKIILMPIEILGMFTKPFSLMIRLFANITAGHAVVMGLIAVGFVMKDLLTAPGAAGVGLLLSTFIMVLKILVSFLQAFIFTMLSALFIGSAVQEHEHH
ncbi:MAG TPA: F0F1 ATP synthase subunit A [Flavobacterium sp.]|nr:F0F1 ATP synthase subunit A [Flavobacterium sp.]